MFTESLNFLWASSPRNQFPFGLWACYIHALSLVLQHELFQHVSQYHKTSTTSVDTSPRKTFTTQCQLVGLAQKEGLGQFERSLPLLQHLHVIDLRLPQSRLAGCIPMSFICLRTNQRLFCYGYSFR